MKKSMIILLVLFSLYCDKEKEPQSELNAEEPTILTYFVKAGDTVSCDELMNEYEEMLRQPKEPQTFGELLGESSKTCDDKYCLEIKIRLENEFNIRYKMLKNDPQYSVNVDKNGGKGYSEETWYEKRFGTTISDFERSITHINFYIGGDGALEFAHSESRRYSLSLFSLTKTATGAVAKYRRNEFIEPITLELDVNEWMDFIRVLYRSCVNEWKKEYDHFRPFTFDRYPDFQPNTRQWKLEKFSLNKHEPDEYYGFPPYPPCWYTLMAAIDTIKNKMYRETMVKMESQLKIDYQKRFGEPITDMELSTANIYYYSMSGIGGPIYFLATRTITGGFVEYMLLNRWFIANLDINEWIDFISGLYKSTKELEHLNDSVPDIGFYPGIHTTWRLATYSLDEYLWGFSRFDHKLTSHFESSEFIGVMTDMVEKVKMKDKQRQIDGQTETD